MAVFEKPNFLSQMSDFSRVYRTKKITFSDSLSKQTLSQTRLLPKIPKIVKFIKNIEKCSGFKGPVLIILFKHYYVCLVSLNVYL